MSRIKRAILRFLTGDDAPWCKAECIRCGGAINAGDSCWLLFGDLYVCNACTGDCHE